MKFKVGDTVTLVKDSDFDGIECQIIPGSPAKIIEILKVSDNNRFKYLVKFKELIQSYGDEDLELFKIKATKLSRKLYPNYKEKEGWLYP